MSDPASFRDPAGYVFFDNDRVLRRVRKAALEDYEVFRANGAIQTMIGDGWIIGAQEINGHAFDFDPGDIVLEHPRLPFVSYPYEWTFGMLKAAALLHLDIQIRLLEHGVILKDATAFNVQFIDAKPVFIDVLSFKPYRDGEPWMGHRQFVHQFLNPLVLRALRGVPHNAWYYGAPAGITSREMSSLLSGWQKLSPTLLSHIVVPSVIEKSQVRQQLRKTNYLQSRKLPRSSFQAILAGLRRYIGALKPHGGGKSTWQDYDKNNTYDSAEADKKKAFVRLFAEGVRPSLLLDIGCNSGEYSQEALKAGALRAIGVDGDHGALEVAFGRAVSGRLPLLPLYQDLTSPSGPSGWNAAERSGFWDRAEEVDAILALAIIHHLIIGGNVPLSSVVNRLVATAPQGVIEFVPKSDPTVTHMLSTREDVFVDYDRAHFVAALEKIAVIVRSEQIAESGRELFWFKRQ